MQFDVQPIWDTWAWLGRELANPDVMKFLMLLLGITALLAAAARIVPLLVRKHIEEVTQRLYSQYRHGFIAKGIQKASLLLIGRCLAWVFGLKLCAELLEPFVAILVPDAAERFLAVALYDWIVLAFLVLLVLTFWMRFLLDVRRYDLSKVDSRIERSLWRAHPLFWKPAVALLVLLFLPDLGKRATSLAADAVKETGLPLIAGPAKAGT